MAGNPRPAKRARRSVSQKAGPSNVSEPGPPAMPSASEGSGYGPQPHAFEQGSSVWSRGYNPAAEGPTQGVSGYGIYATSTAQPPVVNTAPYPMNDYRSPSRADYHPSAPMLNENEHELQYQPQSNLGPSLSLQQLLTLDPHGSYAASQGLPHSYVTGAPVQTQGVPAEGFPIPSAIDPSLHVAEPWTHFRGPFVQGPIGWTSGSTSRKRKAGDEDAEEDGSASISAQHEQERTSRAPLAARLKGKGKARDTDPDAAEGAGPSTPLSTLSPAQSNQKGGKNKDDAAKDAVRMRAHNSASRLTLNDMLCADHKVHYKVNGKKKPEKKILENAIACFTEVKEERDRAIATLGYERVYHGQMIEQLEMSARSLSAVMTQCKEQLQEKDNVCKDLKLKERGLQDKVATLQEEIRALKHV